LPYSERAREMRRCKFTRDDRQCKAWACWDDAEQRCSAHAGRGKDNRRPSRYRYSGQPTRYTPCRCSAYRWPHRPGGGLCRWPDVPLVSCATSSGSHSLPRRPKGIPGPGGRPPKKRDLLVEYWSLINAPDNPHNPDTSTQRGAVSEAVRFELESDAER
jgi:hypothetical protein